MTKSIEEPSGKESEEKTEESSTELEKGPEVIIQVKIRISFTLTE